MAYGNLETSERIRNELLLFRYHQLQRLKRSTIERVFLVALTVLAGVPVLHSLLPDRLLAPRSVWLTLFSVLAAVYAVLGLLHWRSTGTEARSLEELLDDTPHDTEDDPLFLEMQLSAFRTRLELIEEILDRGPGGGLEENLQDLARYWRARMAELFAAVETLYQEGVISEERYRTVKSWQPE